MKRRQAKKIIKNIITFECMYSNYQPYSVPQQKKAFAHVKYPHEEISEHLFYKIPIRYRFFDPQRIAKVMLLYNMQPTTAKEYGLCMKRLEVIKKRLPP